MEHQQTWTLSSQTLLLHPRISTPMAAHFQRHASVARDRSRVFTLKPLVQWFVLHVLTLLGMMFDAFPSAPRNPLLRCRAFCEAWNIQWPAEERRRSWQGLSDFVKAPLDGAAVDGIPRGSAA